MCCHQRQGRLLDHRFEPLFHVVLGQSACLQGDLSHGFGRTDRATHRRRASRLAQCSSITSPQPNKEMTWNTNPQPVRGVQIEANLFKGGKFVDQYSTYVSGSLGPGETRFFKIACGCKDSEPAEHDSFKVSVTSAY